jgi:hypothetical protein
VDRDATLKRDLEALVEPGTRRRPGKIPCAGPVDKSVRQLADEFRSMGHQTSHRMMAELLHDMDYSVQSKRKTPEGAQHPDRDAPFRCINDMIREFQAGRQPVISMDAKKKELVG